MTSISALQNALAQLDSDLELARGLPLAAAFTLAKRNIIARKLAELTPCDDAGSIPMHSVDAGELIAAGVGFQMQNGDTPFGDDGELVGYREVGTDSSFDAEAALFAARVELEKGDLSDDQQETLMATIDALAWADGDHRNRYNSTSEGLADTTELSTGYWEEVGNAHISEMAHEERLSAPRQDDLAMLHGTMEFWAKQREERFERLRRTAKRFAKKQKWDALARLKAGVAERYGASAKLIAERKQKEWFLLYLTSAQVSYLKQV